MQLCQNPLPGVMRMNRRIFVAGTASLLSFVLCSCGIFESGSDVPPPPQGEEWSAKIKSSYPDWQPPREMPEGSAEYRAALKNEQELKALEAKEAEVKTEKSVCPDDAAQKEVKGNRKSRRLILSGKMTISGITPKPSTAKAKNGPLSLRRTKRRSKIRTN